MKYPGTTPEKELKQNYDSRTHGLRSSSVEAHKQLGKASIYSGHTSATGTFSIS
jgi:hypothetical protein